jgi:hypothetical protein
MEGSADAVENPLLLQCFEAGPAKRPASSFLGAVLSILNMLKGAFGGALFADFF